MSYSKLWFDFYFRHVLSVDFAYSVLVLKGLFIFVKKNHRKNDALIIQSKRSKLE